MRKFWDTKIAEEIVEAVVELAGELLSIGVSEASRDKPDCRGEPYFSHSLFVAVVVAGTYWVLG